MLRASIFLMGFIATYAASSTTVLTPQGPRAGANFHEVPQGMLPLLPPVAATRAHHLFIQLPQVVRFALSATRSISLTRQGTPFTSRRTTHAPTKPTTGTSGATDPFKPGWIAYADWYNTRSSSVSSFTTIRAVPPVPATDDGQTVFLFNSIEPASYDTILQPVLQYGPSAAGGGSYWAVASWYLVGSEVYYTTPVETSVGTSLEGVITLDASEGAEYNYTTSFSNIAGTTLIATNAEELVWATETLEAYGITAITDYPSGTTVFKKINIRVTSGTPDVSWGTTSDSADGIETLVVKQGATNAKIKIKY